MRLSMTSTRLAVLIKAYENKHSDMQVTGGSETFDLTCLRDDGFVTLYSSSHPVPETTPLGDRVVESILEAIQKIEIKE